MKNLLRIISFPIVYLIFSGFILRVLLTNFYPSGDAQGYIVWANYLQNHKIADVFEFLPGGYPPYPPVYYYVLKLIGFFISVLNLWKIEWLVRIIITLPVYIADGCIAYIVYKISSKNNKIALGNASFYYFNPAVIFTSVLLGQIDALIILLGILTLLLLFKLKFTSALFVYTFAILTKPQAFALLPLILILLYLNRNNIKLHHFIPSIFISTILFLPVFIIKGLDWTIRYFAALPHWYPYTSIYAYNIWSFFGFLTPDSNLFLGMPIRMLGMILFAAVTTLVIYPLLKHKLTLQKIIFAGFLLFFAFALFSTRIHSRYFIYTIGFFASFISVFPALGILLTFFVMVNLFLPGDMSLSFNFSQFLTHPYTIWMGVGYGLFLLYLSYTLYTRLFK